jgi:hypothetical protein
VARANRSTLELVMVFVSWTENMFLSLVEALQGSGARLIAFFSNHKRYLRLSRECAVAVEIGGYAIDSLDKLGKLLAETVKIGTVEKALACAMNPCVATAPMA